MQGGRAFQWLNEQIARRPEATAIASLDDRKISFRRLGDLVERTLYTLRSAGLERHDRVAIVLPNGPTMAAACLSFGAGTTCVPLNPDYTRSEFEAFIDRLGIRALASAPTFAEDAREAAREKGLALLDLEPADPAICGDFTLTVREEGDLRQRAATTDVREEVAHDDDVAFVLHTSGSTSLPKVVPLTHAQLRVSAANVVRSLALGDEDRCLSMLPLFHVGALVDLLIAPLSVGGEVVVSDRMSSDAFFDALDRLAPTWYQAVPTMLRDLTDRARATGRTRGASSLRLIRSVSAALPLGLLEDVEATFDTPVIEIYGMTETAGLIASNPIPPAIRKPGSVGVAAGPELQIIDDAGNPVRPGESGEVLVRGENVMAGYEGDPEGSAGSFVGHWLRTGDEGRLDEDGFLFLTGRIKEIINRGGEKISPREIDTVAEEHPAVREAAAFALPHETLGEEVGLAVVLHSDASIDDHELIDFLKTRLAYFKLPRSVLRLDGLPKGGSGKLQRHRILLASDRNGLASEDEGARPTYVAPRSDRQKTLASLWENALGVARVGLDDDFFDLGGDSLKAATFIGELQERHPWPIEAAALFDGPTLRAFDAHLEELERSSDSVDENPPTAPTGLRAELYEPLAPYLAAWQGKRRHPQSLVVGRNTLGTRPPLFWGVQGFKEFEALATRLDPDQPIYGFRSLYKAFDKDDATNQELADYYTSEIREIHPEGPILIGGFCEAAKIAFKVARSLRSGAKTTSDGPGHGGARHVALLALQEQFVAEPYDGRIAFFFCAPGNHSPYQYYQHPERGWSKFYRGETALYTSKDGHDDYYGERGIDSFVAQLEDAIDSALNGTLASPLTLESGLQHLPQSAYRARIAVEAPRLMRPGERYVLPVTVENLGSTPWRPTSESGVILANRWRNPRGTRKIWTDGRAHLEETVAPGASVRLEIEVEAPNRARRWRSCTLEVDLVDEGVCWFADRGSAPATQRVWLTGYADFFNRFSRRTTTP